MGKLSLQYACSVLGTSVVRCDPKREYIFHILSMFYSEKLLAMSNLYYFGDSKDPEYGQLNFGNITIMDY